MLILPLREQIVATSTLVLEVPGSIISSETDLKLNTIMFNYNLLSN